MAKLAWRARPTCYPSVQVRPRARGLEQHEVWRGLYLTYLTITGLLYIFLIVVVVAVALATRDPTRRSTALEVLQLLLRSSLRL